MPDLDTAMQAAVAALPGSEASSGGETTAPAAPDTDTADSSDALSAGGEGAGGDSDTEGAPASVQTDGAAPAAPEPAVDPAEDSLEQLAKEREGKRDNAIPHSRVRQIVANAEKKAEARIRAEFETPDYVNTRQAMRVADENPKQFLSALMNADPRYAELLAGSKLVAGDAPKQAPRAAAPATGDIRPDIQLSDGTLGYSAEVIDKLVETRIAAQAQQLQEAFNARLGEFEPIKRSHEQEAMRSDAAQAVATQIQTAQNWPGFAESRAEMAAWVTAARARGQRVTLHDAYIAVAVPKLQQQVTSAANDARQKVLADMKKQQAASTGVNPAAATKAIETAPLGPVDPEEALLAKMKDAVAKLKK